MEVEPINMSSIQFDLKFQETQWNMYISYLYVQTSSFIRYLPEYFLAYFKF